MVQQIPEVCEQKLMAFLCGERTISHKQAVFVKRIHLLHVRRLFGILGSCLFFLDVHRYGFRQCIVRVVGEGGFGKAAWDGEGEDRV